MELKDFVKRTISDIALAIKELNYECKDNVFTLHCLVFSDIVNVNTFI